MLSIALSLKLAVFLVFKCSEIAGPLVKMSPDAGRFHDGAQIRSFELIEIVVKPIEHFLFFFHVVSDRKLNLAHNLLHEQQIDQDIPCTHFQPVFDTHDLKNLRIRLADPLYHVKDPQDLAFVGAALAPQQVADFKGD